MKRRRKAAAPPPEPGEPPEPSEPPEPGRPSALLALALASVVLLGLRLYASSVVGFGDSEALYATWAAHPQPAYLDHPGLVGLLARAIGEGAVPSPLRTHLVTSLAATLVPWLVYAAGRALGGGRQRAAAAGLVVAVVPETAIGLFALTPDLLLVFLWLGALALAAIGLRAVPSSTRSAAALLGAGLLAGVSCAAKVSGLLLVVALLAAYAQIARSRSDDQESANARRAARTWWPWAGVLAGLVVFFPVVFYEAKTGWPMLRHRLLDTQHGAGLALRNLGALLGGQLAYLSPVLAVLAFIAARDLFRRRGEGPLARLLLLAFAVPLLPLVALCLWSPVAEPHWVAPALLALPLHAARREMKETRPLASRRTFLIGVAVAALFTLAAHAWVLVPGLSARLIPAGADAKLDISNELFGWPTAFEAAKDQMASAATPFDPEGREVVVVGPHWTVCAQLAAGLPGIRVGCATPVGDDFDRWLPREEWRRADHVLFVTDNRFPGDGAEQLPAHVQTGRSRVRVLRGGKASRAFELFMYERHASGSL